MVKLVPKYAQRGFRFVLEILTRLVDMEFAGKANPEVVPHAVQ